MITTFWIVFAWVVAIGTMYLFSNLLFWIFVQVFGCIDNYMQDRYWRKRGYTRMTGQDGQEWYVGNEK